MEELTFAEENGMHVVRGPRGAVNLTDNEIRFHGRQPLAGMVDDAEPDNEVCEILGGPCWTDSGSHAARAIFSRIARHETTVEESLRTAYFAEFEEQW